MPLRLRCWGGPETTTSARSAPSISHGRVSRPSAALRMRLVMRFVVFELWSNLSSRSFLNRESSPLSLEVSTCSAA